MFFKCLCLLILRILAYNETLLCEINLYFTFWAKLLKETDFTKSLTYWEALSVFLYIWTILQLNALITETRNCTELLTSVVQRDLNIFFSRNIRIFTRCGWDAIFQPPTSLSVRHENINWLPILCAFSTLQPRLMYMNLLLKTNYIFIFLIVDIRVH